MDAFADSCSPAADNAFGPAIAAPCRDTFDFTLAFEQYFFTIVPSAILILAVPLRLWGVLRLKPRVAGLPLRFLKLSAIVVLASLQLAILASWASDSSLPAHVPSIAAHGVAFVGCILLGLLSFFEHSRSIRPSFLLNAYLFLTVLLDAATLRTLWLLPHIQSSLPPLYTASFAVKVVLLVLEALGKRRYFSSTTQPRSPEEWSGLYSQAFMWWLNDIIWKGADHLLHPTDLYPIVKEMTSQVLHHRFSNYQAKNVGRSLKLKWALLSLLKVPLLLPVIPRLIQLAFTVGQPFLLRRLLRFLTERDNGQDVRIGYGLIGAYGLIYFGMAVSSTFYWHRHYRFLFAVRGSLIAAIYSKAMKLDITRETSASSVTMMSTDVERIVRGLLDFHELWAHVLQVGIATWLIHTELGIAWVGPVTVSLLAAVLTMASTTYTTRYQVKWITATQTRISFTTSVLGAIKSIKICGLGPKILQLLQKARSDEMKAGTGFRNSLAWTAVLANVPMLISPVVTFVIVAIDATRAGSGVDATSLFTTLSLLILLAEPLFTLFVGLVEFMSGLACFERIEKHLNAEDLQDYRTLSPGPSDNVEPLSFAASPLNFLRSMSSSQVISIRKGCFGWSEDAEPVLRDMSISVHQGQGIGLTGPVACGKSTLLKALLGETPLSKGDITISETEVSYCDQSSWLINASVQRNITMFSPWDANLYSEVIHSCDLGQDLLSFPKGDKTAVGSKGYALSGGQRQRLSLARALYARKKLALFDDVLSQLDRSTQNVVFHRVFGRNGLLRKNKVSFILVTHSEEFLERLDATFQLTDEGEIAGTSAYGEVSMALTRNIRRPFGTPYENFSREDSSASTTDSPMSFSPESNSDVSQPRQPSEDTDRIRQTGDVSVYRYYLSSLDWKIGAIFLALQFCYAFLSAFPAVWLKWWTDSDDPQANVYFVAAYGAFQVGALTACGLVTLFTFNVMSVRTGLALHKILAGTIMRAPYALMSKQDSGSLLNRFSQDVQLLDMSLPLALQVVVTNTLICLAQLGLIASASAWIIVSYPFLFSVFYLVQKFYLKTYRQIRYLDLEEKAPLYSHFIESMDGLATIRAFNWTQASIDKNLELIDKSQRPFYLLYIIQRWLVLVLDLIIAGLAVVLVGITVAMRDTISPGFTGVALTQIISFSSLVKLGILFWAQMETAIGAVARIRQFSRETPDESAGGNAIEPDQGWPSQGQIVVENIVARYSPDAEHPTLNEISMTIKAGQKVGICGRTGSGKSSFVLALLRMIDTDKGSIIIDGLNITSVPKESLRSRLISVAEEPFFISGTVRDNLTLYSESSNQDLETALNKVKLWSAVEAAGGLDVQLEKVAFSHGQRQLFNLARALLKPQGKVLILDEFTSSIDLETEKQIQQVVHSEFWDHTILSVAHRLDTILDYDKIAVMEQGKVVEFDEPRRLLESESKFKQLYEANATHGR